MTVSVLTHIYVNRPKWVNSDNVDGLVQERRNSSALARELCLSCTNPSMHCCLQATSHYLNRAGVKYVFVFANTNTNTNTAYLYLYLYLIKFQTMYLYLYLYLIHRIWCIWQIRFQIHFFLGRFLNTNLWKKTCMNILYKHVKECYSFSK